MKRTFQATLFLSFMILVSGNFVSAQTFPCDNGQRLYFFQDVGGSNGSLSCITNYTSGTPVVTTLFPMPTSAHNALAANPVDNYLYYLSSNQLMRLDASGAATPVCTLNTPSLFGCFDHKGRYWTIQLGSLQAYDINTCQVVKGPYSLQVNSGFLDVAFNPKDCHFYIGTLRVDTNGVADSSYPGTLFTPSGTYGGVAIGSDGNIYGIAGGTSSGDLSVINPNTHLSQSVSSFTPGPMGAKSDMASFPCALVNAYFSDSLTSCGSLNVFFSDSSSGPVGNWYWNFGDPASGAANTSTSQHQSHTFSAAGTYTISLLVSTGSNMCYSTAWDTASMVITVSPASVLGLTFGQVNIPCNAACSGTAFVVVSSGNAPYSYLWNTGQTSASLSALCAGTYSVTVSDAAGCSQSGTVSVSASGVQPTVTISGHNTICKNESALISASGGATFLWNTGETTSTITVSPLISTTYSVTAWLNGCSASAAFQIAVTDLLMNLGPDMDLCGKEEVVLSAGDLGATFQWSTGQTSPEITVTEPGSYWLTVVHGNCKASDTVQVTGDAPGGDALYIPNAFTPGNDGLNDFFTAKGEDVIEFNLMIFNRWGEMIFESDDLVNGWDGKFKNEPVQEDVYIYKINYRTSCSGKRSIEKTGHVSVVR